MDRMRLRCPIVGVLHSPTGIDMMQIPSGEVLLIPVTDKEKGLVQIVHRGRTVAILLQDLHEKSERINGQGA